MKKNCGLTILTCMVALFLISGCAKKAAIKGEPFPKESATEVQPAVKTPEKGISHDEEARRRAEEERAAKEAAAKAKANQETAAKAKAAKALYELADINFDYDKFNLSDDARAILSKHADWLRKNKDAKVAVEGHCDERGTAEYNLALGQRRANAAAQYLSDMGIDGKRISTISYGFERPLDPRHNEEAWAKNRRAHFLISGVN